MGVVAALPLAAAAFTAVAQIKGGIDAQKASEYNAAVAKQEAKYQGQRTKQELAFHRQDVERIIGKQRVAGGASGTTGSQSMLFDTLTQANIDEQLIRTEGAMNVWRAKSQAKLYEQQGGDFLTGGFLRGGATILGGLSKFDYRKPTASTKYALPAHKYRSLVR